MIEQTQQKRCYSKIPSLIKKELIQKVFQKGLKIKQAALQLQLKYATAKTIILNYRKKVVRKKLIFKSNKPCLILPLNNIHKKRNIIVVSLVAGKLQNLE
ncbi:unnamed protein product [Paramecium pentaurelia]|uniref:Uncharacterized protein n=1 Tax=Paramecium pentaurelia TaxID=43138 RepID=A0A8S1V713_9CILI|nr:unnamed protein product [Paramecium pentaurelia]